MKEAANSRSPPPFICPRGRLRLGSDRSSGVAEQFPQAGGREVHEPSVRFVQ